MVSLPGYTYGCNIYEGKQVEYIRDKELYLLIGSGLRGGLSGVHGPRYFESNGEREITHEDVNILYGLSITQPLAYAAIEFDKLHLWKRYLQHQIMLKLGI